MEDERTITENPDIQHFERYALERELIDRGRIAGRRSWSNTLSFVAGLFFHGLKLHFNSHTLTSLLEHPCSDSPSAEQEQAVDRTSDFS